VGPVKPHISSWSTAPVTGDAATMTITMHAGTPILDTVCIRIASQERHANWR
jgi:hypothetical protein